MGPIVSRRENTMHDVQLRDRRRQIVDMDRITPAAVRRGEPGAST